MPSNFGATRDGYDRQGYIAATPWYDAVKFKFRLALHDELMAYQDAISSASGARKSAIICEAIATHIGDWDQKDDRGKPIQCTAKVIGTARNPYLVDKLYAIVTGNLPSDPIPAAAESEQPFDAAAAIAAKMEGATVGEVTRERDEKN